MNTRNNKGIRIALLQQAVFALLFVILAPRATASATWLSVSTGEEMNEYTSREKSVEIFSDDISAAINTVHELRMKLLGVAAMTEVEVSDLELSNSVPAKNWIEALPSVSNEMEVQLTEKNECIFNQTTGDLECSEWKSESQSPNSLPASFSQSNTPAQIVDVPSQSRTQQLPENRKNPNSVQSDDPAALLFKSSKLGLMTVESGRISFANIGQERKVRFDREPKKEKLSMFIRDPSIARWDAEKRTLTAEKSGETEVFIVSTDRISIVPLVVSEVGQANIKSIKKPISVAAVSDLSVPESLASIDGLDRSLDQSRASYTSASQENPSSVGDIEVPKGLTETGLQDPMAVRFVRAKAKAAFSRMYVRIVDERSHWDGSEIYPAGGLRVRIIGTEFDERTDNQGYLEITDIPSGARVIAEVFDDKGQTMPALVEFVADSSAVTKAGAQLVMVRRYLSLDYAARLAGVVQNMQSASLCATAVDTSSRRNPLAGVQVSMDTAAIGPFYFNEQGFVDTKISQTTSNGRFCFFNTDPGATAVGLSLRGHDSVATVLFTARGRHTEEMLAMGDARHVTTSIASIPPASEQLDQDEERANHIQMVDQAEVVPIGSSDPMVPIDEGVYTSANPIMPLRGRVWTISNSSDFEVSVQASSIRRPGERQITTLLPRGFVDDMSVYAQTTQDPQNGVVVVEHAAIAGQGSDAVKIRLVDPSGHDAGEGWYFADKPVAKAIFFNVPSGVYSVLVETATGHWLAADTVVAYSESTSLVHTGAPIEKQAVSMTSSGP